jgi:uncharacterized protein (DUF2344 family)
VLSAISLLRKQTKNTKTTTSSMEHEVKATLKLAFELLRKETWTHAQINKIKQQEESLSPEQGKQEEEHHIENQVIRQNMKNLLHTIKEELKPTRLLFFVGEL